MEQITRWRLILGNEVEETLASMNNSPSVPMSAEELLMDKALDEIYSSKDFVEIGGQGGGNGRSFPKASQWLGDIQTIFDKDIVKIIQNDAIERCGLKKLLLEPSVLENMEPDINLASTIMLLKNQVPEKSKDAVRKYIKKIVEDINKKMADDVKRVITSRLNKTKHSPIPAASAIDYKYTIKRNLKNYNTELKTIIPEKVYFFDRANRSDSNKWTIILDVDQSGSMGDSVIYSSVLSCILASISAIKTKVVAFDTQIVDLTSKCDDPVDLLYGFNLGGGTDIHKSLVYCNSLVENPSKTLMFLISDLEEYGNTSRMLAQLKFMKESGVTVVCLLAISDQGTPHYDHAMAEKIGKLDIPCFACSPNRLPELLDCALNHKEFLIK